jgi:hypothetical protein
VLSQKYEITLLPKWYAFLHIITVNQSNCILSSSSIITKNIVPKYSWGKKTINNCCWCYQSYQNFKCKLKKKKIKCCSSGNIQHKSFLFFFLTKCQNIIQWFRSKFELIYVTYFFFVDFLLYWETIYDIKWKILLEERKFSNKKIWSANVNSLEVIN